MSHMFSNAGPPGDVPQEAASTESLGASESSTMWVAMTVLVKCDLYGKPLEPLQCKLVPALQAMNTPTMHPMVGATPANQQKPSTQSGTESIGQANSGESTKTSPKTPKVKWSSSLPDVSFKKAYGEVAVPPLKEDSGITPTYPMKIENMLELEAAYNKVGNQLAG